jgi:EF hand
MKLAAVLLGVFLALPSVAAADTLNPPGGPVVTDEPAPAPQQPAMPRHPRAQQAPQAGPQGPQGPRAANRRQLRQALMQQFDVNGDGRLGPRERLRAIRMLRRLENQLATPMQGGGQAGAQADPRVRRFIRRHDVNGDGVVGPHEMPRGAADRFRRFDRNGDGWVTPDELPPRGR